MTDLIGFAYAATVFVGGLIGYIKAGSTASLLAGTTFGGIAAYAAYTNNNHFMLAASLILTGVMGMRFMNSGKFMPAGLVAALSAFILLRTAMRFM